MTDFLYASNIYTGLVCSRAMGRPSQLVYLCAQLKKVCGRKKITIKGSPSVYGETAELLNRTEQARARSSLIAAFEDKVIFFIYC